MSSLNEKIRIGEWELDIGAQTLSRGDEQHRLNVKMLELLCCLCEKPAQTVSRSELIAVVWKGNRFVGQRGLTNVVWQLRQCLGADAISTVAKVGYRLNLPVTRFACASPGLTGKRRAAYLISFAGAVLSMIAVAGWTSMLGSPAAVGQYVQNSLTFYNGVEEYPAFSATGDYLAFTWEQAETGSLLFIRDLKDASAPLRQVTLGALDEVAPAWGPGDREIAFARIDRDGTCKVVVRSLLSMAERIIDDCAYERYHRILDWSRDGRFLFYARSGPEPGVVSVYRHEFASGQSKRVSWPNAGQEDKQIAVSPDGQLAFVRSTGATADLFVVTHDGGVRQVTFSHEPIYGLAWLDNRRIAINVLREGRFAIWETDSISGNSALLYRAETPFNIAGVPGRPNAFAFSLHRGTEYIQVLDAVTGRPEMEMASTGRDMYGQLSADGERLLFLSTRGDRFEVWIANRDGTNPRQLTSNIGLPDLPVWSPDGRQVAVPIFDNKGRYQVTLFDAASGEYRQLTDGEHDYRNLNWFGREDAVLVSSDRGGAWNLWRLSLDDGAFRQLTDDGGTYGQVFDGNLYYTRAGETGIWRRALDGGEAERIMEDLHRDDWGSWQMTARGLYYIARESDADEVRRRDFHTGEIRTLARFEKNSIRIYRSLTVSESGRLVITRLGNRQADIILVTPDD